MSTSTPLLQRALRKRVWLFASLFLSAGFSRAIAKADDGKNVGANDATNLIGIFLPIRASDTAASQYPSDLFKPPYEFGLQSARAARQAIEAGDPQRALSIFRGEAARKPTDYIFYWLYGTTCARLGLHNEAISAYDRWIELDPTNGRAYANRAISFVALTNFRRAESDANEALQLGPRGVQMYELLSSVHWKKGDIDEAIAEMAAKMKVQNDNPEFYKIRGAYYLSEEKITNAEADFSAALKLDPKDGVAAELSGDASTHKHDWTNSALMYSRAIENETDDRTGSYAGRAHAELKLGRFDDALTDYSHAIDGGARSYLCFSERGYLYLMKRDFDHAKPDFIAALKLKSNGVPAMVNLSECYIYEHKDEEAIDLATRALSFQTNDYRAYLWRAKASGHLGRYARAKEDYEKSSTLAPHVTYVANAFAWLLATCPDASIRDGKLAVQLAEKACAASEWKKPYYIGTLAAAYAEIGRIDLAKKYNTQATELAAGDKKALVEFAKARDAYEDGKAYRQSQ